MDVQLTINPNFKTLIPKLTQDEYALLKASIDLEGCRERIIVWNNTIIDGHNRYAICQELNVEFEVDEWEFESEQEAMLWIINNQLGRRNLSDFQKVELVSKKKDILLEKGKKKQIRKPMESVLSSNDKTKHNTQQELAKEAGMSTGKFAQAEQLIKEAPEEVKQALREGTKTIGQSYRVLKAANNPTVNHNHAKSGNGNVSQNRSVHKESEKLSELEEFTPFYEDGTPMSKEDVLFEYSNSIRDMLKTAAHILESRMDRDEQLLCTIMVLEKFFKHLYNYDYLIDFKNESRQEIQWHYIKELLSKVLDTLKGGSGQSTLSYAFDMAISAMKAGEKTHHKATGISLAEVISIRQFLFDTPIAGHIEDQHG